VINSGTVIYEAKVTAIGSTTFTLNFTTANATAFNIILLAFCGTDITSSAVVTAQSPTSAGAQTVTIPTGVPQCVLVAACARTASGTSTNGGGEADLYLGAATSTSSRWGTGFQIIPAAGGSSSTYCAALQRTDHIICDANAASSPSTYLLADITGYSSGSLQFTWSNVDPTAGGTLFAVAALYGTFQAAVFSNTAPTSNGNQSNSLSFTPTGCLIASDGSAASTSAVAESATSFSIGVYDGTNNRTQNAILVSPVITGLLTGLLSAYSTTDVLERWSSAGSVKKVGAPVNSLTGGVQLAFNPVDASGPQQYLGIAFGAAASPPGIPTGLAASYGSATSVALSWTQGSGTVTDNKVQWSTDNATWTTVDQGSAVTSATITGLTQNNLYFFRVDAENTNGGSGYTSSVLWVCGCNAGGQVAASNADAFENTLGTVTITDATDTLVALDYLGFYYTTNFPQFADVSAAFLVVNLASITGIAGSASIDMQNAIPSVFAATSTNISSRTLTGESVNWPIAGLTTGWNQSPNFASAADAVLNNPSWSSNSAVAVVVKGLVGAAGFDANMWDGSPGLAAWLFIAYSTASTDDSGAFGDQMGLMAQANAFVANESHEGAFVAY